MTRIDIKVKVTKFRDRKAWLMYYDCPLTGKRVSRSTGTTVKREAEKAAGKWEDELRTGRYKPKSNVTWAEFRERYESEVVPSLADKTHGTIGTALNAVERICNPHKLSALSADRLSYLQKVLRDGEPNGDGKPGRGRSEATIKTYLAHLLAALKWACEVGMLGDVPKVRMPQRAKGQKVMKGRPVTGEEYDRMVASVRLGLVGLSGDDDGKAAERKRKAAAELPAATVATWERLLRGLWLSGLRLGEAINLTWDDDTKLTVDLSGRRPMFRIRAAMEKGNRDRVLPMTPDFAAMLQDTPKAKRTGPVFPLLGVGGEPCHDFDWASRIVGRVGRAAGVKVNTADDGTVKYASAHDLRRSFGARWAPRVMPIVLQQLMRHESIDTTLRYYVGQDAESLADAVWAAAERAPGENVNTFVNSR